MTDPSATALVSVIIPAYNYAHFLPEALESVLAQSYEDWECIIVDDGSADNTGDLVANYLARDSRFKYIFQENRGLSAARNTGIKHAQGQFFQFLDADDLIESNKLAEHALFLKQHAEVDIVYSEARYFSTENPEERRYTIRGEDRPWIPKTSGAGQQILKTLLLSNIMVVSAPLVRKNVFTTCGLFDESLNNQEDWEFWMRCAQHNRFFHFYDKPATFTLIRYHQKSMSQSRAAMFETNLRIRKNLAKQLNNAELIKVNKRRYQQVGYQLALDNIANKQNFSGFIRLLRYALMTGKLEHFLYGCKLLLLGSKA